MRRLFPRIPGRFSSLVAVLVILGGLGVWLAVPVNGAAQPGKAAAERAGADDESEARETARVDPDFPGAALLDTDSRLARHLKQAADFAEQGQEDVAIRMWQQVLDEQRSFMFPLPREKQRGFEQGVYATYESAAAEAERALLGQPAELLETYQLVKDAEASVAVKAAGDDPAALSRVVRRYFATSAGDDAAYRLASARFDRGDFVQAARLFERILREHPEPSVPNRSLMTRLAFCYAMTGNAEAAEETRRAVGELPRGLRVIVEREIERRGWDALSIAARDDWPMALGNPARNGHAASLPASSVTDAMAEAWVLPFDLEPHDVAPPGLLVPGASPPESTSVARRFDTADEHQAAQWRDFGRRPTTRVLVDEDRVYFKADQRLVCCDLDGNVLWMGRRNEYDLDRLSQTYAGQAPARGSQKPKSAEDVRRFGDRVHQSMAVVDDLVVAVEGRLKEVTQPASPRKRGGMPRRERQNWLAAYDAFTGKLRWYRPVREVSADELRLVGFLGDPVPAGELLLAPVTDGGELWLYALRVEDGETVWKTYLSDEPRGSCVPWSPVGVAVDGTDAYVASGAGLVFALNADSGRIRWATRYQREDGLPTGRTRRRRSIPLRFGTWTADTAIVHGRHLVVCASDSDRLFALDRQDGRLLWDSPARPPAQDPPLPPSEYVLGVIGDRLYVAGTGVVRQYDVPSGKLGWEKPLEEASLGRAVLVEDAIYVPAGTEILRIDPGTGDVVGRSTVSTPGGEPVGNLRASGGRLLTASAWRVYELTPLENRLRVLAERIGDGDVAALRLRARLFRRLDRDDQALLDLHAAVERTRATVGAEQGTVVLLEDLSRLRLATSRPRATLSLIAEDVAARAAAQRPKLSEALAQERASVLYAALTTVSRNEASGALPEVLAIVPLCSGRRHLLKTAQAAARVTATAADAEQLLAALESSDFETRSVAIAALRPDVVANATDLLRGLLDSPDERTRLEAAVALGNQGERAALPVFVRLLESDDLDVRTRSVTMLRGLSGRSFQYAPYESAEYRKLAAFAWEVWLDEVGGTAKLQFPVEGSSVVHGRTLACNYSTGKVTEFDESGKEVWQVTVPGPYGCEGLPNGHRLVASYQSKSLFEYDRNGKLVWSKKNLAGRPFIARRLSNGNTLVGCYDNGSVVEYAPDGSVAWQVALSGNTADVRRLSNGNTLVARTNANEVVEIDRSGKHVRRLSNMNGPRSAQPLPNGNVLVSQYRAGRVVEVDPSGRVVWKKENLRNPYDAQRLPNGNTLIVHQAGILEVEPGGRTVWEKPGVGFARAHRF